MPSRRPLGLALGLAVLGMVLGIYLFLTPSVIAQQRQVDRSTDVQNPLGVQAQATPGPTASPTPPIGGGTEGIPTPGVLIIIAVGSFAAGVAVGYYLGSRRQPPGPIDRAPGQRRG